VDVVDFIAAQAKGNPNAAFAGSVPYLMLAGNLMAGWQMAVRCWWPKSLAEGTGHGLHEAKITTARFYADHILSRAPGVRDAVEGADSVTALSADAF
jgi:hypothetical protein